VVSGGLDLDFDGPLFGLDSPTRPIVITGTRPSPEQLGRASEVAEVIVAGTDRVDVGDALKQLGALGARVVLCEGGPSLNGQLVAADLIDESCVTVSPLLIGGESGRIMHGLAVAGPRPMRLARVLAEGDMLMMRYVRP
jgi:riboflavin biosynthesis pyrimidine reductase